MLKVQQLRPSEAPFAAVALLNMMAFSYKGWVCDDGTSDPWFENRTQTERGTKPKSTPNAGLR